MSARQASSRSEEAVRLVQSMCARLPVHCAAWGKRLSADAAEHTEYPVVVGSSAIACFPLDDH